MSCHNAHASNFTYMLIKTPAAAGESLCKTCGLCLECHHNMFP
ncbi:MAG: cytochrome c3 family protein [Candidatus Korobacteraceae bacterium]